MALGCEKTLSPSIEAVAAKKEGVRGWVFLQRRADPPGQSRHVLVVLHDGDPLTVFVRRDAMEAFEHLVAFDLDPALRTVYIGEHGPPNRVGVKHARALVAGRPRREAGPRPMVWRLVRPTGRACSSTVRMSAGRSVPLWTELAEIARRNGSSDSRTLKLPLVPITQSRADSRRPTAAIARATLGNARLTRDGLGSSRHARRTRRSQRTH